MVLKAASLLLTNCATESGLGDELASKGVYRPQPLDTTSHYGGTGVIPSQFEVIHICISFQDPCTLEFGS